jgi:putative ABC transport system substrate-binding protein
VVKRLLGVFRARLPIATIMAVALLVVPLAADAQHPGPAPRVGYLASAPGPGYEAFRQRLRELGYIEGQTIVIQSRFDRGDFERAPALAAELLRAGVDVIVASAPHRIRAAQRVTSTVPIVMSISHDPVEHGLVASYARPGANTTGLAFQDSELTTKRLQILKEALPSLRRLALLYAPAWSGDYSLRPTLDAARSLRIETVIVEVRDVSEFESAFASARRARTHAVFEVSSPFFQSHRQIFADLAIRNRFPATCEQRTLVEAGCLMSYGPNFNEMTRRAADFVDRIVKGAHPADLPVERISTFELVINAKTAKALKVTIPPSLLLRADQVIE